MESNNDSFHWPKGIVSEGKDFSGPLNSTITESLMIVNDTANMTSREREKKLRELFKKIGIKVKFVP